MDQEIILSLLYAERGSTSGTMEQHRVESPEALETWVRLAELLAPLGDEALELAAEYGALKEQDGFLNGFRLAVRLLMDSSRGSAAPAEMRPGA